MQRPWVRMTTLFLLVSVAAAGWAQRALTVGAGVWRATMDHNWEGVSVDPAMLFGPVVQVNLNQVMVRSSFYMGQFAAQSENGPADQTEVKRSDLSVSFGLPILRYGTVFAEYKKVKSSVEATQKTAQDSAMEWSNGYIGAGGSAKVPIAGLPLFVCGSLTFLASSHIDVPDMQIVTLGLDFLPWQSVTISVGYKMDIVGMKTGEKKIHGMMATATYTIR